MPLSEKEQQQINTLVGRFEADTGIQAVAAVVGKADAYPEIPWKAYAIGSALGALAIVLYPYPLSDWGGSATLAFHAMAILGAGAMLAAAAAFIPPLARLFLDRVRAEGEVRQYGLAMFVEREIFCTSARRAVLLLLSRFERVALILPDTGLAAYAPAAELERIAAAMRAALANRGEAAAFETGFQSLKALVQARGYSAGALAANELDNAVVTEKGA
jgi:uncharacterized membrane protein